MSRRGDVLERRDRAEALRVGDEPVDAAEPLDGLRGEIERAVAVGDVPGDRERFGAELAQLGGDGRRGGRACGR